MSNASIWSSPLLLVLSLAQQQSAEPPAALREFVADVVAYVDEAPDASLDALRARFDETLKGALSKSALRGVLNPMRAPGDVIATLVERVGDADGVSTWRYSLEQPSSLHLTTISLDAQGRVCGWWVKPAPMHRPRAELVERTRKLEGDWALALESIDANGKTIERVELGSGGRELFPLGSIFKLYVLAELARQVDAGTLKLDGTLSIVESAKSLPSGKMHELAVGTPVELRAAARDMIAISDNTATDHLLALLGRENVEAHLGEYGNSAPERNRPFLSTLEMFALKGLGKSDYVDVFGKPSLKEAAVAWAEGSVDERRRWLERALDTLDDDATKRREQIARAYNLNALGARSHVEIEWFAKPADVVALIAKAVRGELVSASASRTFLDVYAAGSAVYERPEVVAQGFKGGSEAHVLAFSSRVVLRDGRCVIACMTRCGFDATDHRIEGDTLALYTAWLRNLLDGEPGATAPAAK